jgi:pyruvate dehydrogenase E2 component (dihydrolipoamide acetyltransferase)
LADVVMPQLGETVTEGTVTKWLKAVGDSVERDEPLFEVSTDKVDSEVPSPASGLLTQIVVPEGETVDVGTVVAVVSDDRSVTSTPAPAAAASAPAAPAPAAPAAPAPAAPAPAAPAPAAPAAPAPPPAPAPAAPAPPPAPAPAPANPVAASAAGGVATTTPAAPPAGRGNRILSPVVRRLLDENGIEPDEVPGTGLGGRITRADVLGVIDARRAGGLPAAGLTRAPGRAAPAPAPAPAAAPAPAPAPAAGVARAAEHVSARAGTDEVIAFTNIRRRTAEHMVRSKATSAHTLVVVEVDYETVEQVRRTKGRAFRDEEGFSLTYLPFVARATVEALREWPELNASVGDDALIVHHQINLGVAVDLDHRGLIVPVVPRAEELTLRGIARRIRDLADRARTKKLSADDITGGTFSITNAGPYGTFLTAPIINQPQIAILSTDGVKRRPTVVTAEDGTEAIAIHSMGMLALSWDHRAVDGAYAAAFVHRVAELLSSHDWAAEL